MDMLNLGHIQRFAWFFNFTKNNEGVKKSGSTLYNHSPDFLECPRTGQVLLIGHTFMTPVWPLHPGIFGGRSLPFWFQTPYSGWGAFLLKTVKGKQNCVFVYECIFIGEYTHCVEKPKLSVLKNTSPFNKNFS